VFVLPRLRNRTHRQVRHTKKLVALKTAITRGELAFLVLIFVLGTAPATAETKAAKTKSATSTAAAKPTSKNATKSNVEVLPPKVALVPGARTLIATANARFTPAYRSYSDKKPFTTFDAEKRYTGKSIFTVLGKQGKYLIVNVPSRPNGSTAFVLASSMTLSETDALITVSLKTRELVAYRGQEEILRTTVAVGQGRFPTPKGTFYTLEVAKLANPAGAYGPYALGLSGFSTVLTEFGRGDGQLAIHGTNQPALLGQNVSHGCIRISNEMVTRLVQEFPLGAPVVISD
jgi:lipoprotein-anchoring transpeptidase ErfK/SrfK